MLISVYLCSREANYRRAQKPFPRLLPSINPFILILLNDMHDIQPSTSEGSKHSSPSDVKWKETLDKVAAAVVSVKFCHTLSFDAEEATSSEATGFVVDAKNG